MFRPPRGPTIGRGVYSGSRPSPWAQCVLPSRAESVRCLPGRHGGRGGPLEALRACCPDLDALTRHVRSFASMLAERRGAVLPDWLTAVTRTISPASTPSPRAWPATVTPSSPTCPRPSSGVGEGRVNRVQILKRHQMFGRTGFHLVRKRARDRPMADPGQVRPAH